MPKVSVIIPTYNRGHLIVETLNSVFAQRFTNYEIIVVDDESTDDTEEVLKDFVLSGKIQYIRQDKGGQGKARNTGINASKGEFIAFLDSDDKFVDDTLVQQLEVHTQYPEAGLVHGDFIKFDNRGNDLGIRDTSFFSGYIYPEILLYWKTLMATPCVMIRRSFMDQVGFFDESLKAQEDLDYWRRIARVAPFVHIPRVLAKIRSHSGSMSSDKTHAADTYKVYFQKAFEDDPTLDRSFRSYAMSNMYLNIARNLMGEGRKTQMQSARQNCIRAIKTRPSNLYAYFGWCFTWVPYYIRQLLARVARGFRYGNLRFFDIIRIHEKT
jgi:glycosyltransferase involved in cell wall biosynthesis